MVTSADCRIEICRLTSSSFHLRLVVDSDDAPRFVSLKQPKRLDWWWVENRQLPIIAFKHKSVGREGIRDLLHLNPIEFTDENEVLAELPKRLKRWKSLKPSGIELQLVSDR